MSTLESGKPGKGGRGLGRLGKADKASPPCGGVVTVDWGHPTVRTSVTYPVSHTHLEAARTCFYPFLSVMEPHFIEKEMKAPR